MIAYVDGRILQIGENELTVVIHGIGYQAHVPGRILEKLVVGDEVQLHTHQHVREDALELFGFTDRSDLAFFRQLIQVAGVGTRLALTLLSQLSADEIKRAIIHGDLTLLTSVSGVGKKTAERIVLDLKESIAITDQEAASATPTVAREAMSAIDALTSLGYSKSEALQALAGADPEATLEEQVRAALKQLSGSNDSYARR